MRDSGVAAAAVVALVAAAAVVALLVVDAVAGVHTCCIPCYVSGRSVSRNLRCRMTLSCQGPVRARRLNAALHAERSKHHMRPH